MSDARDARLHLAPPHPAPPHADTSHPAPPHDAPLYLEPRLAPGPAALLRSGGRLHELVDALGSPLNVVLPGQLAHNLAEFGAVLRRHHLSGRIYLAHKATGSSALVRQLAVTQAGIDAASLGELQHALGAGFTPDRVMATGPKDPAFLWLAARAGVTVHLDGPAELEAAARLVRTYGLPRLPVVLRLAEFETSGPRTLSRRSRFGTAVKALGPLLDLLGRHREALDPVGVGYHLDTTSADEKAVALEGCLRAVEELRLRDFAPRAVDVGGGFGVSYLARADQWERYTTALTEAVLGRRPPMTWGGHGYGLRVEHDTLKGALALYPAHRPVAGAAYLDELLRRPAPSLGRPLGTLLLEGLCDLYAEPGRALVDQCGLTLGRVLEVREDVAGGPPQVRLALNAGDVGLEEHGVLVDPVLLPRAPDAPPTGPGPGPGPVGVHLMGNLCLEADLITRRIVLLPRPPRPGDLLAFPNTAGYCMDFTATRAQRHPPARRIAVGEEGDTWRWCLDEQYWPVTSDGGT
ncbi:Y4yA family PLP-dependent enzyme [Streptomyces sp. WAC06614]|uniref:Y4yA family PLP-dependent enzyme n=1 Tax=Streptomyces sp. WAC06614 TaxID=2487416 RepID=UPI000F79BDB1|nr:Y4yA family PLP-dependent enzyme [Streptomyces sp. WAC06614]RSS81668.1 Y4yA family PLP-dependent enzyme [Streptomyces sp. WAC06614]